LIYTFIDRKGRKTLGGIRKRRAKELGGEEGRNGQLGKKHVAPYFSERGEREAAEERGRLGEDHPQVNTTRRVLL